VLQFGRTSLVHWNDGKKNQSGFTNSSKLSFPRLRTKMSPYPSPDLQALVDREILKAAEESEREIITRLVGEIARKIQ